MSSRVSVFFLGFLFSSVAYAQSTPSGDSVARIKRWVFACSEAGRYSLEVRNANGIEVTAGPRDVRKVAGADSCSFPLDWSDSHRLSRGYLELHRPYSWRVRDAGGKWSAPVAFESKPIVDFSFASLPPLVSEKIENWKVDNGWLVTELSRGSTRVFTNFDVKSLPGERKEVSRALSNGTDYLWRLEATCPDSNCQVGLVFAASQPTCGTSSFCGHQTWYELRIRSNATPQLLKVVTQGADIRETVLQDLAESFIDLSYPQEVRIIYHIGKIYVALADGTRRCLSVERPFDTVGHSGVIWTSNEDDDGVNRLRVDRVATAASPDPVACNAPLPML